MSLLTYLDFDLEIERATQGYRVEVNSPAGQSSHTFALPFSDLELEQFLLRLGRTQRGVEQIDALAIIEAAKAFGGRLFNAVFDGDVRTCLRSSLEDAARRDAGLRLRLRLNDAPELADLPWEYLYHPALNRFLALSAKTPIVRYLELPEYIRPLAVTPPLRVLVLIASPRDLPPLDVAQEWNRLSETLTDLDRRGMVMLERLEEATMAALQRRLRQGEYHILHFIGHGGFDEQSQGGMLMLEDEAGASYRVSGHDLGTLLYDHDPLRLAILNACEGGRAARNDPFAGVAQNLVQQGTPAVIAMQFAITDEAAVMLAREFYGALVDNYPVDAAVAEARRALFAQGNGIEWGTPVLYMRAPDGRIFDVGPVQSLPEGRDPPRPSTPPPAPAPQPADPEQVADADKDATGDATDQKRQASFSAALSVVGCQVKLLMQVAVVALALIGLGTFASNSLFRSAPSDGGPAPTIIAGATDPLLAAATQPAIVTPLTSTPARPTHEAIQAVPSVRPTLSPSASTPTPTADQSPYPYPAPIQPTPAPPCPAGVVLTGAFGSLLQQNTTVRDRLGCALANEQGTDVIEQPFERGSMIWLQTIDTVYVLLGSEQGTWRSFAPEDMQDLPTATPAQPPDDLVGPTGRFGMLWSEKPALQQALGWGEQPEAGHAGGALQRFAHGTLLFSPAGMGRGKTVYALYDDGHFERFGE